MTIAGLDSLVSDPGDDLDLVFRLDLEAVYVDARTRLLDLVAGLDERQLTTPVPACPGWTVKDVITHLVAVAAELYTDTYPDPGNLAWRDPAFAVARDAWNADNLLSRSERTLAEILAEWDRLEPGVLAFHRTGGVPAGQQPWVQFGYVVDLPAHLHDIRHALSAPGDRDTFSLWACFTIYRVALDLRLREIGLPAIALQSEERTWTAGDGPARAVVSASPFDLYRAIGGRRSWEQICNFKWEGDPEPYHDVIALYPLPPTRLHTRRVTTHVPRPRIIHHQLSTRLGDPRTGEACAVVRGNSRQGTIGGVCSRWLLDHEKTNVNPDALAASQR